MRYKILALTCLACTGSSWEQFKTTDPDGDTNLMYADFEPSTAIRSRQAELERIHRNVRARAPNKLERFVVFLWAVNPAVGFWMGSQFKHPKSNLAGSKICTSMRQCVSVAGRGSAIVAGPASSAKPSGGVGRWLLDLALSSPLYKAVLVPQAKATMVKTAEDNGVPWRNALAWVQDQGPWALTAAEEVESLNVPEYYRQPFHAYEDGNLCWDAALEAEIASRAVGARNFPAYGADGEEAFRGAFEEALDSLGARVPDGGTVVDLGCGTGISTRRIAEKFPDAANVVGIDLSPYFIQVGRRLLQLGQAPLTEPPTWRWINRRDGYADTRIELRRGLAEATGLADASVEAVNLGLVIHELPPEATLKIAQEAYRILRPGGQLWITEMDFQTPAFSKLRNNPLLFSLIRSTEPYLDVYADYQPQLAIDLGNLGFGPVRLAAATGRHFALVATKAVGTGGPIDDRRSETAKEDTHLKTWESKRTG